MNTLTIILAAAVVLAVGYTLCLCAAAGRRDDARRDRP